MDAGGHEFRFYGDLYSQESTFPPVLSCCVLKPVHDENQLTQVYLEYRSWNGHDCVAGFIHLFSYIQVLLRMGFTQHELDNHFGGAAFLAWLVFTGLEKVHVLWLLCSVIAFVGWQNGHCTTEILELLFDSTLNAVCASVVSYNVFEYEHLWNSHCCFAVFLYWVCYFLCA